MLKMKCEVLRCPFVSYCLFLWQDVHLHVFVYPCMCLCVPVCVCVHCWAFTQKCSYMKHFREPSLKLADNSFTAWREHRQLGSLTWLAIIAILKLRSPDREDSGGPADRGPWRRTGWEEESHLMVALCTFPMFSLENFALFELFSQNCVSSSNRCCCCFHPHYTSKSCLLSWKIFFVLFCFFCQQGRGHEGSETLAETLNSLVPEFPFVESPVLGWWHLPTFSLVERVCVCV